MADTDKSILEYISEVDELLEVSKFLEDKQIDEALGLLVKLVQKPDIPGQVATKCIVQLQAISAICAMRASYYKNIVGPKAGTDEYRKKNLYFSLHEALNEVVAAVKYNIRGSS
jgi:hypothetical protein